MKITKSDFKIIFNKIINNSNDENNRILHNLSNNSLSGDHQIDQLVGNYSSDYISNIMNKINKNGLIGGQTSEEPKNNTSLINLSESDASVIPPKYVNIINMTAGNNTSSSGPGLSYTSAPAPAPVPSGNFSKIMNLFKSRSPSPTSSVSGAQQQAETSETSPFMRPTSRYQEQSPSPTSSVYGAQQVETSETSPFMRPTSRYQEQSPSPTSSVKPGIISRIKRSLTPTRLVNYLKDGRSISPSLSSTSSINTEIVNQYDTSKKPIYPTEATKLLDYKNKLLNKKESELKSKENDLRTNQEQLKRQLKTISDNLLVNKAKILSELKQGSREDMVNIIEDVFNNITRDIQITDLRTINRN